MAEGGTGRTARERKSQLQRERRAVGRLEVPKPAGRAPLDAAGNPCQWTVAGWFDTPKQMLHVPARNRAQAAARATVAAEKKAAKALRQHEQAALKSRKQQERHFDRMWKDFQRHKAMEQKELERHRRTAAVFTAMGFENGVAPLVQQPYTIDLISSLTPQLTTTTATTLFPTLPAAALPATALTTATLAIERNGWLRKAAAKQAWLVAPQRARELIKGRQCEGITKAGKLCRVHSCMWSKSRSSQNAGVSYPLRCGSRYCWWHRKQAPPPDVPSDCLSVSC